MNNFHNVFPIGVSKKFVKRIFFSVLPCFIFAFNSFADASNFSKSIRFDDKNGDGIPDNYTVNFQEKLSNKISCANSVLSVVLEKEGTFRLCSNMLQLEPNKKYIFSISFKIDNMRMNGKWYNNGVERGLLFLIYGAEHRHIWAVVTGNGASPGWVNLRMLFDTGKTPQLQHSRIIICFKRISGEIKFKDPSLRLLEEDAAIKKVFVLENGALFETSRFDLNKLNDNK